MNKIYIFDSVKKQKVEFVSIKENIAKIYVCGPTVYDDSHLGHARSAIAFDLLHRVLKANNYEVIMTKNFTDIDDKIIKKMHETNQTLEKITITYINAYKADMKSLNILDNTIEPKATENLEVMKDMILNLLKKILLTLQVILFILIPQKILYMVQSQIKQVMKIHKQELNQILKKEIHLILLFGNLQKQMM